MTEPKTTNTTGATRVPGIRRLLITPLSAFVLCLLVAMVAGFIWHAHNMLQQSLQRRIDGVQAMFQEAQEREARLIESLLQQVTDTPCITQAYTSGDREALLACSKPLYAAMHATHLITHFYFHTTQKKNFLRVHHPSRHSDTIARYTLDTAIQSNSTVHGLEIGPYGSFVLRVVMPWRVDGKVVGYLELGKEINEFTTSIKRALTADLIFLVHKELINRKRWEEGQRMLGHDEDWSEYEGMVVIDRTIQLWDPAFNVFDHQHTGQQHADKFIHVSHGQHIYNASAIPLQDVQQRNTGHVIILIDVTGEQSHLVTVAATTATAVLVISLLFGAYLWLNIARYEGAVLGTQSMHEELRQQRDTLETTSHELQQRLHLTESRYQRALTERQALIELMHLAIQETTLEEYMQQSLKQLIGSITWVEHLPEAVAFVVRYADGRRVLEQIANYNLSPALVSRCSRIEPGECLCGRVAQSEHLLFSGHVDEQHEINFENMSPHGHWVVPIKYEGALVGVFNIYTPHGTHQDERTQAFLMEVSTVFGAGIYRRLT